MFMDSYFWETNYHIRVESSEDFETPRKLAKLAIFEGLAKVEAALELANQEKYY